MWSISTVSELADLPGLTGAKLAIGQIIERDSPVQSVLLYGAEGTGKTALANILAEHWVRKSAEDDRAVTALRRGNNADVLHIHPSGASDLMVVAQIRFDKTSDVEMPLRDFFRSLPIQSKHKVAILHRVDRMNARAANALLKTLEEPLPHAKLILTTAEIGSVLATVRSRCLNLACELPVIDPAANATPVLQILAAGSPGKLARLQQIEPIVNRIADWVNTLVTAPPLGAMQMADRLAAIADDLQKVEGTAARFADAQVLSFASALMAKNPAYPPAAVTSTIEAHRSIIGNANVTITLDALVTNLMIALKRREREPMPATRP